MSTAERQRDTAPPAQIPRMDLVRTVVIGDVELRFRAVSMPEPDIDAALEIDERTPLDLDQAIREGGGFGTPGPIHPGAPARARLDVTH
jgi:hypothetical protein